MKDHKIRKKGRGEDLYKKAEEGWNRKVIGGIGIPPLRGYRKVGFIKADRVFDQKGVTAQTFTNMLKHELGHMFGRDHGAGVMIEGILTAGESLDYVDDDKEAILLELMRLRQASRSKLEERYIKQTS
jgi:hypothetical protein